VDIKKQLKKMAKAILKKSDIGVTRFSKLEFFQKNSSTFYKYYQISQLPTDQRESGLKALSQSISQFNQDLFVLIQSGFKKNGYFIEFGATNGLDFSNTYILEKDYGWSGILSEPAVVWQKDLRQNRSCIIDEHCIWKSSGDTIEFLESGTKSGIRKFIKNQKTNSHRYQVKTLSLNDLLEINHAPKTIDYLSIDTEGSELTILEHLDFEKYDIKIITCEHNFSSNREKIYGLLISKGYTRKYPEISMNDDWYVKP
jgi:FkbM family methyltransferase